MQNKICIYFILIIIVMVNSKATAQALYPTGVYEAVSIVYQGDSISIPQFVAKRKPQGLIDFGMSMNFMPEQKVSIRLHQYTTSDSAVLHDIVGYKIHGNQLCLMESNQVAEHSCLQILSSMMLSIPLPDVPHARCYLRKKL